MSRVQQVVNTCCESLAWKKVYLQSFYKCQRTPDKPNHRHDASQDPCDTPYLASEFAPASWVHQSLQACILLARHDYLEAEWLAG